MKEKSIENTDQLNKMQTYDEEIKRLNAKLVEQLEQLNAEKEEADKHKKEIRELENEIVMLKDQVREVKKNERLKL